MNTLKNKFLVLSLIFAVILTTNCKDSNDDMERPTVTFSNPFEGETYSVPDTINVIAEITDNKNIKWLRVTLVDRNQQPVSQSINIENINQKKYKLNIQYPVTDIQLPGGDYYMQVEASDGNNTKNGQKQIHINEAEKQLKYYLLVTRSNPKEVSVSILDKNYNNTQFIFSENTDYLNSCFISRHQQLIISGKSIYKTRSYGTEKFNILWSISVTGTPPDAYFTDLESGSQNVILSNFEGFIQIYDENGHQKQNLKCGSNLFPYETEALGKYILAAEQTMSGNNNYLTLYHVPGGGSLHKKYMVGEVEAIHGRSGDKVVVTGNNNGNAKVWHYDPYKNNLQETRKIAGETIQASCRISDKQFLLTTETQTYTYTFNYSGDINCWKKNFTPNRIKFEPLTNTVIAVKNKTVYFLDLTTNNVKTTTFMNNEVLNVHPVYNR